MAEALEFEMESPLRAFRGRELVLPDENHLEEEGEKVGREIQFEIHVKSS